MSSQYGSTIFYNGLVGDPIRAITDALVENLGSGNFSLAHTDYLRLTATIESRGRHGKDIRYAHKELGELRRRASKTDRHDIAEKAASYANQLPHPLENGRRTAQIRPHLYIPQPASENGDMLYSEVKEIITKAVVDRSDGQEPLNEEVLDTLIAAFGDGIVDIHTVSPKKIAEGYNYLSMFNPSWYDLLEVARMFVRANANISKLESLISEEE